MSRRPLLERARRGMKAFRRELLLSDDLAAVVGKQQMGNRFFLDWIMRSVNADEEVRRSARRLRARARDLRDTAPYVEQALQLTSNAIIGPTGPAISPQIKQSNGELDVKRNAIVKDGWKRFSESMVTTDGKRNLVEEMHAGVAAHMLDGELFTRVWEGFDNDHRFALETIDPDHVDDGMNQPPSQDAPRITMGIELDRWRRPLAYHVTTDDTWSYERAERQRIPADQIIHNFRSRRLNQTRAQTWFLPVLVALKMDASYTEAELMAACIGAAKMGFFRTTDGQNAGEIGDENKDGEFTMEVEPGIFGKLPAGWTVEAFNTDHPTGAFAAFQKQIGRKISVGIGLSYPSLSGDLEAVNYGSMRGGKLDERDFFMRLQEYWVAHYLNPIYRRWLRVALLTGKIDLGSYDASLFYDCEWICRGWPWVDPMKDTQASALAIENGLDSRTRILAEQGLDFQTIAKQLAAENELAKELGISISGASVAGAVAAQNAADAMAEADGENNKSNGRVSRARRHLPFADAIANGNGH